MWLGIDFGTYSSKAALLLHTSLTLVKSTPSSYLLPSNVFVSPSRKVSVGNAANTSGFKDPNGYLSQIKQYLDSDEKISLNGHFFPVAELIQAILLKHRTNANTLLKSRGQPSVTGVVLTVPALYQGSKRDIMKKAAVAAGFISEKIVLVDEPIAAALYYEHENEVHEEETFFIYDWGGGTFNAAILRKTTTDYEYLAVPQQRDCGGTVLDNAIYEHLVQQHPDLSAILNSERSDEIALHAQKIANEKCIELKHQLSEEEEAEVTLALPGVNTVIHYRLTQTEFNTLIRTHVQETIDCCEELISNSSVTWEKVSRILLVGGTCCVPFITHELRKHFPCPIILLDEPDLMLCQGAAIYGETLEKSSLPQPPAKSLITSSPTSPPAVTLPKVTRYVVAEDPWDI